MPSDIQIGELERAVVQELFEDWQFLGHGQHSLEHKVQVGREPWVCELCCPVVVVNKVHSACGRVPNLPSWRQRPQLLTIHITKIPTETERGGMKRQQAKQKLIPNKEPLQVTQRQGIYIRTEDVIQSKGWSAKFLSFGTDYASCLFLPLCNLLQCPPLIILNVLTADDNNVLSEQSVLALQILYW